MLYTVPFNIDLEDVIVEDENLTSKELLNSIKSEGENHNVSVDIDVCTVTGDIDSLASFFIMLDGPGPSFNMEEFSEWVVNQ